MALRNTVDKALAAVRSRPRIWLVAAVAAVGATWLLQAGDQTRYERFGFESPPYQSELSPRDAFAMGQARAAASGKMLMVTFGANWCPDCLTLQRNLRDAQTRAYAEQKFEMVHIDVGDNAKNDKVKRELGIRVNGIPLAVFYSSDGDPICDTQGGELKPSRHYTSHDILEFLREVVEHGRVVSPDQRQ